MASTELLFKALADGTRQRLVQVLSKHELSVSELVEVLGQPQSTISRHLKVLHEAGLLVDRRAGTTVMYATHPPAHVYVGGVSGARGGATAGKNDASRLTGASGLRDRLLDWVGQERLVDSMRDRLERVIRRRHVDKATFFDAIGARWDQLRIEAFGEVFHFEALTSLLPAAWTVADIGTGTGYLLGVLAARFRKVIAVDPAHSMLDVARHRPEVKPARNVSFRQGSLADLPLQDGEVDLAIASLVLHHVDRPATALGELRRCLRDGGKVMIIEQHAHRSAAFHDRMGDQWWGFAPAKLARWLRRSGFVEVRTRSLTTARPTGRDSADVPPLFVATAEARGRVHGGKPGQSPRGTVSPKEDKGA